MVVGLVLHCGVRKGKQQCQNCPSPCRAACNEVCSGSVLQGKGSWINEGTECVVRKYNAIFAPHHLATRLPPHSHTLFVVWGFLTKLKAVSHSTILLTTVVGHMLFAHVLVHNLWTCDNIANTLSKCCLHLTSHHRNIIIQWYCPTLTCFHYLLYIRVGDDGSCHYLSMLYFHHFI